MQRQAVAVMGTGPEEMVNDTARNDALQTVDTPPAPLPSALPAHQPRAGRASGRRIALVIDRLAGRGGGAERVLSETANALALRGHLVEIITHERSRGVPFYPLVPGVMLTRLRPPRPFWRAPFDRLRGPVERHGHHLPGLAHLAWTSRHGGFWRRLARYLEATRPDAVAGVMPPAITAVALATRRLRARGVVIPTVASTHNAPGQDFINPARWGPGWLDRSRRLAALDGIDRIAVLLPEYRDWHSDALRPRITVLPNAVAPVPKVARARPGDAKVVLAVGRLVGVKRQDMLIAAWATLAADFPDWQLRLYGHGPLDGTLAAQIAAAGLERSVTLMGQHREMAAAYGAGAILAHPSAFEGFPLAVCEALAAGLPVVGFADCSGTNALVRDGETGVLVPATADTKRTARVAGLAAALRGLMADPARRAALGAEGPTSMASYAPERVVDMWEALMLGPELVSEGPSDTTLDTGGFDTQDAAARASAKVQP